MARVNLASLDGNNQLPASQLPPSVETDIASGGAKPIDSTGVANGQSLFYNAAGGKWLPGNVVVSLSANNTFTGDQTYQGQLIVNHGVTQAPLTQSTFVEIDGNITNPDANVRPSAQHVHFYAAPSAAPLVGTDFHGIDSETSAEAGSNINGLSRIYANESDASNNSAVQMDSLYSYYGLIRVGTGGAGGGIGTGGGGTNGWGAPFQSSINMANAVVVTSFRGYQIRPPGNSGGGGTITNTYGLYVPSWVVAGITYTNYPHAIHIDANGGQIVTNDVVSISNGSSDTTGVPLTVAQHSAYTGHAVSITNPGTGSAINASQTGAATAVNIVTGASANYALTIGATGAGNPFGAQITTSLDGGNTVRILKSGTGNGTALLLQNKGTGATFSVQTGSGPTEVWQVDSSGNISATATAGLKIGTTGGAAGQKLGFFNATPVVQPLLATGAAHTVDDVITTLQTLGLVRQT